MGVFSLAVAPNPHNSSDLLSEENVKRYVLPHYGLENSEVIQIKFKDTDKQRAVYRVDHNNHMYCLKKVYFPLEELLFVYSVIEWLYRKGLNVPRILPTKSRSRYVEYETMLFILTPWVEGTKCSYDNISNILDSSSNLAKLHNSTESFVPISGSVKRESYEDLSLSLNKHFEQLLLCSNMAFRYGDKFSKVFLDNFEANIELAEVSARIASTINHSNLRRSLCHLDYVNKNIIFDNENKLWLIDFDKCKLDFCIHDISYFLRRLLKRDNTKWDLEIALSALKLYEEKRPLNLDEYKAILVYLAFPQKYWKISRDYYNNINKCNKNSFVTLLKKACEKNEFHTSFVNGFKNYIEERFHVTLL